MQVTAGIAGLDLIALTSWVCVPIRSRSINAACSLIRGSHSSWYGSEIGSVEVRLLDSEFDEVELGDKMEDCLNTPDAEALIEFIIKVFADRHGASQLTWYH
jgi:hypothetical protein